MSQPILEIHDLGRVDYRTALALQDHLVAQRQADRAPDRLLLLEHERVFTTSRRGGQTHLLVPPAELARRGIDLVETDRGGDITYHGPGQLVGYLIARLEGAQRSVPGLFMAIEGAITAELADHGLAARGGTRRLAESERADLLEAGVWIGNDKICAVGMRLSRWVTKHGFALNVDPEMSDYQLVIACGLQHRGNTSMAAQLGRAPAMAALKSALGPRLAGALGRRPISPDGSSLDTLFRSSL